MKQMLRVLAAALCVVVGGSAAARAAEPATAPAKRSGEAIDKDLQATWGAVRPNLPSLAVMTSAEKRQAVAPKITEPLRKMLTLMDELGQAEPAAKESLAAEQVMFRAMLDALGEAAAGKELSAQAAGTDKDDALRGKMGQKISAWMTANGVAAAQGKVLDDMLELAKANPTSVPLGQLLIMLRDLGKVSRDNALRCESIVTDTMRGDFVTFIKEQIKLEAKQRENLDKPVIFAGKTMDGKDFSTKDYAGKVVLLDFWATWCGPCEAELPRVKEVYEKYHAKGLEIVGLSCDTDGAALAQYIKENSMGWVQLWDKATQEGKERAWHAVATEWGVQGIPTMFLIDRAGVLRSVKARADFEEMIPQLLDEAAKK